MAFSCSEATKTGMFGRSGFISSLNWRASKRLLSSGRRRSPRHSARMMPIVSRSRVSGFS
jgi:hypothetical protein